MWATLSRVSQRRLGPTLADFRSRGARGVRAERRSLRAEPLPRDPEHARRPRARARGDRQAERGVRRSGAATSAASGRWRSTLCSRWKRCARYPEIVSFGERNSSQRFPPRARSTTRRCGSTAGSSRTPAGTGRRTSSGCPSGARRHSRCGTVGTRSIAFASAGDEAAANAWVFTARGRGSGSR